MACIPILTYCCVCTPIPAATNCHSTSPQTPPLQGNTLQHVNGAAAANGCHSNKGHTPIQQDHQQEVGAEVWWSGCTQDRLHSAHIPSAAYAYLHDADCGCRRPWRAMKACTKHIFVNPSPPLASRCPLPARLLTQSLPWSSRSQGVHLYPNPSSSYSPSQWCMCQAHRNSAR